MARVVQFPENEAKALVTLDEREEHISAARWSLLTQELIILHNEDNGWTGRLTDAGKKLVATIGGKK